MLLFIAIASHALACPINESDAKFVTSLMDMVEARPTLLKRAPVLEFSSVEIIYANQTADGGMWLISLISSDLSRFDVPNEELTKKDMELRVWFASDGTPAKSQIFSTQEWPVNEECFSVSILASSLIGKLR